MEREEEERGRKRRGKEEERGRKRRGEEEERGRREERGEEKEMKEGRRWERKNGGRRRMNRRAICHTCIVHNMASLLPSVSVWPSGRP